MAASLVKNWPADAGDVVSIPELVKSPGEGHGNQLQYSCLDILMDREACGIQSIASQRVGLK